MPSNRTLLRVSLFVAVGAALVLVGLRARQAQGPDGLPAGAREAAAPAPDPSLPYPVADVRIFPDHPMPMYVNPDCKVISPILLLKGFWEPQETHWALQNLREGDTFLDVGANIGYYTLIAAHAVGETGRVYAFEPDPVSFEILEHNVRLHELGNVVLEQKAAANEPGSIELFLAADNKGDHRIYQAEESRPSIAIEAVTLDGYFETRDRRVDFAKIDTQGAEVLILQGMAGLIAENEEIRMAVEFWPFGLSGLGSTAEELLTILESHDFLFFDLESGAGTDVATQLPLRTRTELLETHTVENQTFTNLLVARGRGELDRLTRELESKREAFERTPGSADARRAYDQAREGIEQFKARAAARTLSPS